MWAENIIIGLLFLGALTYLVVRSVKRIKKKENACEDSCCGTSSSIAKNHKTL
jgi:hypothetical protein